MAFESDEIAFGSDESNFGATNGPERDSDCLRLTEMAPARDGTVNDGIVGPGRWSDGDVWISFSGPWTGGLTWARGLALPRLWLIDWGTLSLW